MPVTALRATGTRVVLMGTGTYQTGSDLPGIPSVVGTLADLGRALVEQCGLAEENLRLVVDPQTPSEMGNALAEQAEQAEDVLLVYYVGHGLVSPSGELYLAAGVTDSYPPRLKYSALSYSQVRNCLWASRAQSIVVILDCYFPGRALGDPEAEVAAFTHVSGGFVLTSAARNEVALAPPGARHTAFTGELIRMLTEGDPKSPHQLTLRDVYRYLSRELSAKGLPQPHRQASAGADDLVLAPNPAWRPSTVDIALPSATIILPEGAAATGVTEYAEEDAVDVNVSADMPSRVQVGTVVSVVCHVSQAEIDVAADRVRDQGWFTADPSRSITLQLLPKADVEVVNEDRADVSVPAEGETRDVYFDVRPTHAGMCKVWVVVRQGPMPLLTLQLEAHSTADPLTQPSALVLAEANAEVGSPAKGMEDIPWLSVVEIDRGQDTIYRFDLRSTTLGIVATFESSPLRNRAQYIANLHREIENRWLTTTGDAKAFQEQLREFGGALLTQLFPEPLQAILWEHRHRLRQLVMLSSEPFIPWELVHLKEPGQPLPDESWFLAQLGLVRWLYCGDGSYPTQTLHARDDRIRVLCPDYVDPALQLKQTPREKQFLIDQLGAKPVAPQESEVRAMLRAGGFDILHFAGHGLADSADIANAKLLLEGRQERGTYVRTYLSATTVEQQARLADPNGDKPLVVLNACQVGRAGVQMSSLGGFAYAFLNRGAGAFISSMWSVGDKPASTFVTTLYEELLRGRSISEAAVRARAKARKAGDGTWLAYAVYAHPQARLHTKPTRRLRLPSFTRSRRRGTTT